MGIELISILETEDMSTSESNLFEDHRARLSSEWLELDAYQLQALRSSTLQIDMHSSHYLTPQLSTQSPPALTEERTQYETLVSSYLQGSERQSQSESPAFKQYGRDGLRRHRYRPVPSPVDEDSPNPPEPPEPGTISYKIWLWTEKYPNVLPTIVTIAVLIIIALMAWVSLQTPRW